MIYNNSYFKEELKKSYLEGKTAEWRFLLICIVLALVSIGINLFFNAMLDTIVGDFVKFYAQKSFFAVMSIFNTIILLFFAIYMLNRYSTVTFSEINKNRWYMLKKMGYSVRNIVASKQIATLMMAIALYAFSLFIILLLCVLFKFDISITTLLSLCIVGLTQLLSVTSTIMFLSHFVKSKGTATVVIIFELIFLYIVKHATGFLSLEMSATNMQFSRLLFKGFESIYTYILLSLILICIVFSSLWANHRSKEYQISNGMSRDVVRLDYLSNKQIVLKRKNQTQSNKVVKGFVYTCLCLVILCAVAVNVLMIFVKMNDDNTAVGAYTPFSFGSNSMSPLIEKNDFVMFKNVGADYAYNYNDVILYYDEDGVAQIATITSINNNNYTVDVLVYQNINEMGSLNRVIEASDIRGILTYRNRWLGAWIVLNNYPIGKVFTMVLPLAILAFYEKIAKALHNFSKSDNLNKGV